jgi:hypothetical protein
VAALDLVITVLEFLQQEAVEAVVAALVQDAISLEHLK